MTLLNQYLQKLKIWLYEVDGADSTPSQKPEISKKQGGLYELTVLIRHPIYTLFYRPGAFRCFMYGSKAVNISPSGIRKNPDRE
ncbi:hypothetical protein ES707_14561 [subsurface metagenome]